MQDIRDVKIETVNGKKPHRFFDQFLSDYRAGKVSRREFLAYSTGVGVTAASALALVGEVPEAQAQTPKRGGTLRVAQNVLEIKDPAYYEWSEMGNGSRDILEYLVKWNVDGTFKPWLLESWDLSDDGLTWTLNVRQKVRWSNGDEFTAEDVAFNITRWLNKTPKPSMQSRVLSLAEEYDTGEKDDDGNAVMAKRARPGAVEIVNRYKVRLNAGKVDVSLIPGLADYPAAIVHRSFDDTGSDFLENPIGTGPFVLKEYKVGERIIKERRPDGEYWNGDAYLDRIVYVDLKEDPAQLFAAFSSDQIDLAYQIAADQVDRIEGIGGLKKYEADTGNTGIMRFNTSQAPFDNPKLRQAIRLCADNAAILKVAHNNAGIVAEHHHAGPFHPEYVKLPKIKRNIAKAKSLLKEIGMAGGEVELKAVNNPEWESQACLALAAQAKEAGLTINVNVLPGDAYWAKWDEWDFSLTNWNFRPMAIQCYNLAYRSGAVWNETAYNNPKFDKLLDKAHAIQNAAKRAKVFGKIEKILQDDCIMVQPLWRGLFTFSSSKVQDYELHPAYEHHFGKVWLS